MPDNLTNAEVVKELDELAQLGFKIVPYDGGWQIYAPEITVADRVIDEKLNPILLKLFGVRMPNIIIPEAAAFLHNRSNGGVIFQIQEGYRRTAPRDYVYRLESVLERLAQKNSAPQIQLDAA